MLTGVLEAEPAAPICPLLLPAWVFPLMLPAVLGLWLEVLVEGYWLELALLEVCGGVLVELDGACELDEFEVAVPLMLPLVPAAELDVLGLVPIVLEEPLGFCSAELDGLVLEELG